MHSAVCTGGLGALVRKRGGVVDRCDHSATVGATLDKAIAVGAIGSPRECAIASSRERVSIQKVSASVMVSLLPSSATIVAVTVPWGAK